VFFDDGARERGDVGRGERAGGHRAAVVQPAFGRGLVIESVISSRRPRPEIMMTGTGSPGSRLVEPGQYSDPSMPG